MGGWMIGLLVACLAGALVGWILARRPTRRASTTKEGEPLPTVEATSPPAPGHALEISRLPGLVSDALREPLSRLRRMNGSPDDVRVPLDRLASRLRLLDSRPRPMHAKTTSPVALLQEVGEEVALLRTRAVGTSWSLRTRSPVTLDPDRTRFAFRELLEACAEGARTGGKVGIRVLPGPDATLPVCIEVEIGRRFAEVDPLALLVVKHLLESQGARVEVDARVTRITLPSSDTSASTATPTDSQESRHAVGVPSRQAGKAGR